MLYFAYGSNLDEAQMRARCAGAAAVARATLPNHALTFGGFSHRWGGAVASVARSSARHVQGLLYRLGTTDLRTLDSFEGHPYAYLRVVKMVVDEHGRRRRVLLYQQPVESFQPWAPPAGYLRVLQRAYRRLGFNPNVLAEAAGGPR